MLKTSVEQIKQKAREFAQNNKRWHFHILTLECQLNETREFALILENITDNEEFVSYSDKPYMGLGEELVKLLYGSDVITDNQEKKLGEPSISVKKMLKRAKELNQKGVFWHHHMLFPGCKFNQYKDKWVIVFEDKEQGKIIESISDIEPKNDLRHIERLFYSQKR